MKKTVVLLCVLCASLIGYAQIDTLPLFKQFPDVPPFSLLKIPDSTIFKKEDLQKKTPTLIVLFSPDCEHCQHFTSQLIEQKEQFKKIQIIMVSYLDVSIIKTFYYTNHLQDYKNITVCRDGQYFLGTFYNLHTFPSIILYNKKGRLVKNFDGLVKISDIIMALKN
jgi:thioredoxin-related protein